LSPLTEKFSPPPSPIIRWAVFVVIALLALAVRLPHLGERPLHTDEAVNAYIIGGLLAGEKYHYDPQDRHGPALYVLATPVAQASGARNFAELTESELRLSVVLTGTATVLLFGAGVEMFGFIPCLVAALLFAFAPLPVYYSRDFIHETLFVFGTLGLILSGWHAQKQHSIFLESLTGLCAALMLASKETAAIHFFALGSAALFLCLWKQQEKSGSFRLRISFITLAVFVTVTVLLFTWGGQNWVALADLFRAIPHFAARAGGQGHEKPFWYYFHLLAGGWSGAVILVAAGIGLCRAFRSPAAGIRFAIAIYTLLIAAIYSAIPYKTPWLALNFWLPVAVLAGIGVERLWLAWPRFSIRTLILIITIAIGFLIAHDTRERVFQIPADEKNPYAYAQTGEDLLRLAPRLEELARRDHVSDPLIAVVADDPWPLPWYLRKFSRVGFWRPGQETGPADFFITTTDVSDRLAEQLENFRPEFFGVRPEVLLILWLPPATNTAAGTLPSVQP
jgi:uncharacterized protein (TIGR03663 family)